MSHEPKKEENHTCNKKDCRDESCLYKADSVKTAVHIQPKREEKTQRHWCDPECLKSHPTKTEEWKCPCGRPAFKFDICDSAECKEKYVLKEDKPAEWEEHFKNKYVRDDGLMDEYYDGFPMADEIKSFIHSLLISKRKKLVEEISSIVEMNVGNWTEHAKTNIRKDKLALQDAANEGWNNCRKIILSLIKENNE